MNYIYIYTYRDYYQRQLSLLTLMLSIINLRDLLYIINTPLINNCSYIPDLERKIDSFSKQK